MTKHLTQKQATELWTARIKEMQASMRKDIETKATYDGEEKYKEAPTGKQEEMGMTAASAGIPHDTKNMGPRDVTDKRYKKDKPPVIKRGFKNYIGM